MLFKRKHKVISQEIVGIFGKKIGNRELETATLTTTYSSRDSFKLPWTFSPRFTRTGPQAAIAPATNVTPTDPIVDIINDPLQKHKHCYIYVTEYLEIRPRKLLFEKVHNIFFV